MRAALEENELVNGRKEGVPEDSIKEVDIEFTMQNSLYILPHHLRLPLTMDTHLRAHGGAHRYETSCRLHEGEHIGARCPRTRPQFLSRPS
jgi:hypothetical protein